MNFGPVMSEFKIDKDVHPVVSFLKKAFKQIIPETKRPIFTILSPHGRYLIVHYRFDSFSDRSRDVAMATNFRVKIDKIGLFAICSPGIPKWIAVNLSDK